MKNRYCPKCKKQVMRIFERKNPTRLYWRCYNDQSLQPHMQIGCGYEQDFTERETLQRVREISEWLEDE